MENLSLDKLERYLENHCNNFNLISSAGELSTNHFPRYMLKELQSLVDDFLSGNTKIRWVIISGLRGVGKTTLLLQLYIWLLEQPNKPDRRPDVSFLSLDYVVRSLNQSLDDCLDLLQRSIFNQSWYNRQKPLFLLIDEIQEDPAWVATLKNLYDHGSQNIFLISTGSAAVNIQTSADLAGRRAIVKKLHPLSFIEYQQLQYGYQADLELQNHLRRALYHSSNSHQVFEKLKGLEPSIKSQLKKYDLNTLKTYLHSHNLPYAIGRQEHIYSNLRSMVNKIVFNDLPQVATTKFDLQTLYRIDNLLLFIGESGDSVSLDRLSKLTGLNKQLVRSLLAALVKAELLIKVPPYAKSTTTLTTNPARYYFLTPALRIAHNRSHNLRHQAGQILENMAALYYHQQFGDQPSPVHGQLTHYYDSGDGHCDFILRLPGGDNVALEFGLGRKSFKQIHQTAKLVDCLYGLVFCRTKLELDNQGQGVLVPIEYFFLT